MQGYQNQRTPLPAIKIHEDLFQQVSLGPLCQLHLPSSSLRNRCAYCIAIAVLCPSVERLVFEDSTEALTPGSVILVTADMRDHVGRDCLSTRLRRILDLENRLVCMNERSKIPTFLIFRALLNDGELHVGLNVGYYFSRILEADGKTVGQSFL